MAQFLNRIGQLGLGVAIVGGVVNSALYNGELINFPAFRTILIRFDAFQSTAVIVLLFSIASPVSNRMSLEKEHISSFLGCSDPSFSTFALSPVTFPSSPVVKISRTSTSLSVSFTGPFPMSCPKSTQFSAKITTSAFCPQSQLKC